LDGLGSEGASFLFNPMRLYQVYFLPEKFMESSQGSFTLMNFYGNKPFQE
jgi:hypothetical protein